MANPGQPTLDQLRIFLAVVEEGSFTAAARRMNRAVSVISYGIGNLESQLGIELFVRAGTRKPVLSEAGRAVLTDARAVADGLDALHARVKGLLDGLEPRLDLVVDVMLPPERLSDVLRAFSDRYPSVDLHLHVETLGAVSEMVRNGRADVGVTGPLNSIVSGVERVGAGSVTMVPVAAPGHPLAQMSAPGMTVAREYLQLVLSDRSDATEGRDFGVTARRTWRLADLGAKHSLLREGLGWGNMPLFLVDSDIREGRLVRLAFAGEPDQRYRFHAIWRRDAPPGPAGTWLRDRFVETSGAGEHAHDVVSTERL